MKLEKLIGARMDDNKLSPGDVPIAAGPAGTNGLHEQLEAIYRTESRRVFATLVRLLGDFDLAEEALHDSNRLLSCFCILGPKSARTR